MKTIIVSLLIFPIFLFSNSNNSSENYEIFADEIINSLAKEIYNDYGLASIGTGGSMPFDIEKISIEFMCKSSTNIEEARKLLINVNERFCKKINAHEKIRPYLRIYPIDPNSAQVSICFMDKNNTPYTDSSVMHVFQVRNKIFYYAQPDLSKLAILLKEEPYEEALKIVKGSN